MLALKVHLHGDLSFIEKEVEALEKEFAEQIVIEARRIIDESMPRGRMYRRRAITGRATNALLQLGLKRRGKTRVVSGYMFHRASAEGQPPAKDTERLYREMSVRRSGRGKWRVDFKAPYAGYLEVELNRPFALPAVEAAAKKVFNQ